MMPFAVTWREPLRTELDPKLLKRYALSETLNIVGMGVILFLPAGRLDWWEGWAALAVNFAWLLGTAIVILRYHPALMADRLGPRIGSRPWDKAIVSSIGLSTLIRYVVAGLDHRYVWSGSFPIAAQLVALGICALGYALFVWATYSNAFFSRIVRVQSERGHTVARGGPYRFVRHPAYLGVILYELAISFLLASWWALIPSGLGVILLILRTAFEDRTLQGELEGYPGYARQVHYRLLPGIW